MIDYEELDQMDEEWKLDEILSWKRSAREKKVWDEDRDAEARYDYYHGDALEPDLDDFPGYDQ
jgi:hypothetical protein